MVSSGVQNRLELGFFDDALIRFPLALNAVLKLAVTSLSQRERAPIQAREAAAAFD
jgi:hypothetical protein